MSDTYRSISECLVGEFGVAPELVRPEATLAQLELDSLALVELSLMVEERFAVTVSDLRGELTLAELAELAERRSSAPMAASGGTS